jgi:hypothetical protein
MTSPVDTVRRFYDALGRGDVLGGQDLRGEVRASSINAIPDDMREYPV